MTSLFQFFLLKWQQSSNQIDSALVSINGLQILFPAIKPSEQVTKTIFKDSIPSNKHDVMITANIYSEDTSKPADGFYYDDLSGLTNDSYTITLTANNHIDVR
jgi:predicted ATPase